MALKAHPDIQKHLLDLQVVDTRLQQLDHQSKKLPVIAQLAEAAQQLSQLQAALRDARGHVEDSQLELNRIADDSSVVDARIARDLHLIEASASAKELAGLEHELAGLRERSSALDEMQLAVMERLEEHEAVRDQAQSAVTEHAALIARLEAERDEKLAELRSDRDYVMANREHIVSLLPEDLLALYEKQRARYGFGASRLQGGVSGASGVRLNEHDLNGIRAAAPDDVILCPDSHAILVRTEHSGL